MSTKGQERLQEKTALELFLWKRVVIDKKIIGG